MAEGEAEEVRDSFQKRVNNQCLALTLDWTKLYYLILQLKPLDLHFNATQITDSMVNQARIFNTLLAQVVFPTEEVNSAQLMTRLLQGALTLEPSVLNSIVSALQVHDLTKPKLENLMTDEVWAMNEILRFDVNEMNEETYFVDELFISQMTASKLVASQSTLGLSVMSEPDVSKVEFDSDQDAPVVFDEQLQAYTCFPVLSFVDCEYIVDIYKDDTAEIDPLFKALFVLNLDRVHQYMVWGKLEQRPMYDTLT